MKSVTYQHLLALLEATQEIVISIDSSERLIFVNARAKQFFNLDACYGTAPIYLADLLPEVDYSEFKQVILPQLNSEAASWKGELSLHLAPEKTVAVTATWLANYDATGQINGFSGVFLDLSKQKDFEGLQRLALAIFESTIEGIMVTDGRAVIQQVNAAFTEITGYSAEEVIGLTPRILRSEHHDDAFYKTMWETIAEQDTWQGEIWNRRKNGSVYLQWLSLSCLRNQQGEIENYVSIIHDLSELRAKEAEIQRLVHQDILTGLGNRHLLNQRLRQAVRHAAIQREELALVLIDLGKIEYFNETYGHTWSDKVIRTQSKKLHRLVGEADTLVRTGADEFALLVEDSASSYDITQLAYRIKHALQQPVQQDSHQVVLSPSIGVAFYPADGRDHESLLVSAQTALRDAKSSGRDTFRLFDHRLSEQVRERLKLEQALRKAIHGEGLSLHFQPKVQLIDETINGVEALIRWQHPELGAMSPAVFIPLAEEAGLINAIGAWVIEEACRNLARWKQAGYNLPRVAINVAVQQLEKQGFPDWVEECIYRHGLELNNFELEITETGLIQNEASALDTLSQLKQKGFRLALDDFGTGYSSLSYLRKLPLSTLKIDRSFIQDMSSNDVSLSIVRTIVQLAHNLKLDLVAEGIEEEHQARQLLAMGCQLAQGFHYYRPMPETELVKLLKN